MNAIELTVDGIFQTSSKAFDDISLRAPIDVVRQLLQIEGAHRWVIQLDDTELTDDVVDILRNKYRDRNDVEIVPWIDLAPFYKKVVVLFSAQVNLVRFIIALIILVSISNTLIMSVTERVSEVGTLMAVGIERNRILTMFMSEGVILGVAGGVVGVIVGWLLAIVISDVGIPMPPAPGTDYSLRGEIIVTVSLAIGAIALAVIATTVASIYPAYKASRLEIVDALRHSK